MSDADADHGPVGAGEFGDRPGDRLDDELEAELFGDDRFSDLVVGTPAGEELERLRSFCSMLPETKEIDSFGNPTFRVATKGFAVFELRYDHPMVCFKTTPERQTELTSENDSYRAEPDTGAYGWTLVRLDGDVTWDDIDELLIASYRLVAPSEFVAQLDSLLGPR